MIICKFIRLNELLRIITIKIVINLSVCPDLIYWLEISNLTFIQDYREILMFPFNKKITQIHSVLLPLSEIYY